MFRFTNLHGFADALFIDTFGGGHWWLHVVVHIVVVVGPLALLAILTTWIVRALHGNRRSVARAATAPAVLQGSEHPGGLLGVVEFGRAAGLFPQNVVDVLKLKFPVDSGHGFHISV